MRVIAGKWRGRVLQSPKGLAVRPTTDRVKEALFSIIGPQIQGSVFVDICCGAGGLGIEALSRSCARSIMVDVSAKSLDVARANLKKCGAEKNDFELVRANGLTWLESWVHPTQPFIVVSDPPYESELVSGILCQLLKMNSAENFLMAVVEHGSKNSKQMLDTLTEKEKNLIDVRRYGQSSLALVRPMSIVSGEGME